MNCEKTACDDLKSKEEEKRERERAKKIICKNCIQDEMQAISRDGSGPRPVLGKNSHPQ